MEYICFPVNYKTADRAADLYERTGQLSRETTEEADLRREKREKRKNTIGSANDTDSDCSDTDTYMIPSQSVMPCKKGNLLTLTLLKFFYLIMKCF